MVRAEAPGPAAPQGRAPILSRALWTVGGYGASLVLRLGSNVVLSRLLAPEILGVMAIINSLRYGVELLTDVGIEQNIVHNKRGLESDFENTAWTLQILRGAFLSAIFLVMVPFVAPFYRIEPALLTTMSAVPLLGSLTSTAVFRLSKQLDVRGRNLFELRCELLGFVVTVGLALATPTAWAPVVGALCAVGGRAAMSYRLPRPSHRLLLNRGYIREIVGYGKWIMVSSLLLYASTNLDRIFLGRVEALTVLGIYSLARTIADLPPTLAGRLSYQLLFPTIAAARTTERPDAVARLSRTRLGFVLLASFCLGTAMAWSDVAVRILYDVRYASAGWMLLVLLGGSWFAVLANLNEAILLGNGRPLYGGLASGVRLAVLAVGLPLGFWSAGLLGAILAVSASEVGRYGAVLAAQARLGQGYVRQDLAATAAVAALFLAWTLARQGAELGQPWLGMPGIGR
jgi:O-antigen/teichoic acid export membrane protein